MKKIAIFLILSISITYIFLYSNGSNDPKINKPLINTYSFQELVPKNSSPTTLEIFNIQKRIQASKGNYSLYIKVLRDGRTYGINENSEIYAASLFKVPLAVATLKKIEANEKIDQTVIPNLTSMLKQSDNTAQEILRYMLSDNELENAFSLNKELAITDFYHINYASSKEVGSYLERIIKTSYISETSKNYLLETISETIYDDRIHQGLNSKYIFSHKIGTWPQTGSWHDCGYLMFEKYKPDFVICLMSENTTYEDFIEVAKEVGKAF